MGRTTTRLSRRLALHRTAGAPRKHLQEEHGIIVDRKTLEENTEILTCGEERRLAIPEALYIKEMNPALNQQTDNLQVYSVL
ncbi:hypothetical protein E2C01_062064 [Portunus trituberculatus]|uniref:Uncharacterized protein n=1 Tax=Portunus trituberculatus TaxID=210409 RepID=A0A5B7HG25_PORTR|nr:hypothetical protein [Portunus trituberculatus]